MVLAWKYDVVADGATIGTYRKQYVANDSAQRLAAMGRDVTIYKYNDERMNRQ